jgi:mitochondrial fission protein ELM1
MNTTPEIWALIDDKPGHRNQVIGVAEALGQPYSVKKLTFNDSSSKPNFLKGANLKTIDVKQSDNLSAPWPDIIISAGRRSVPVVKYIKKQAKAAGKKTIACQLMWPGISNRGLDIIAVPAHDNLPKILRNSKKVFTTHGAPNLVGDALLKQEYKIWSQTLGPLPAPRIIVLLGGNSKRIELTTEDAGSLSRSLVKLMNRLNGSVYISSSRRTPQEIADFVYYETKRKIGLNIFHHNFNEQKNKANPYYALLEIADMIIITGDSISMCSEACSTGKPVFIYKPEIFNSKKHQKFMEDLFTKNFAYNFDENIADNISVDFIKNYSLNKTYANPAKEIAGKINELYLKSNQPKNKLS